MKKGKKYLSHNYETIKDLLSDMKTVESEFIYNELISVKNVLEKISSNIINDELYSDKLELLKLLYGNINHPVLNSFGFNIIFKNNIKSSTMYDMDGDIETSVYNNRLKNAYKKFKDKSDTLSVKEICIDDVFDWNEDYDSYNFDIKVTTNKIYLFNEHNYLLAPRNMKFLFISLLDNIKRLHETK